MSENKRNNINTQSTKRVKNVDNIPGKKTHKRRKFKGTRLFKILRMSLLIIIILFIVNIIFDVVHYSSNKIKLVIGENQINLKHDIIYDEDHKCIYLSMEDITNLYDENIFYNNDTVITTYNKHVAVLEKDKTTMSINDAVIQISGSLKKEKDVIYLPFSDMENVYDFEYSYNNDSKVLLVDSISEAKKESVVLKNVKLKEKTGFFSKSLEKLKKSTYVTVLGEEGKYSKVRTSLGNIGYVKTKKISTPEQKREKMEEDTLTNINILQEYSNVDSSYQAIQDKNPNNIVIPNIFNIPESFEVEKSIDLTNSKFTGYKQWADENSIRVCPKVTLSASMNKLCDTYVTRTYVINSLYTDLIKNKLKMICIDFETIDDKEGFYRFIIEMVQRFKEAGIKVIVKNHEGLDKQKLEKIVDFVID